jgi:hypothetical protein
MKSLTRSEIFENELSSMIGGFFHQFGIASILKQNGAYKKSGIPAAAIFRRLFSLAFACRSMFMMLKTGVWDDIGKDTFYRFIKSSSINWLRFTSMLSAKIINGVIAKATDENRVNVFIVDDTLYERTYSKKTELVSWVHDHVENVKKRGYRLLTLGWSDGNTFMPVCGVPLSSAKQIQIPEDGDMDKRSCGYKRRAMALTKAPEAMLEMIRTAVKSGLSASYVLFDSWFSSPASIMALEKEHLDVIAMVKKTSKVHYLYGGEMMPVTAIYKKNRKRRGRSKYLLSVEALVCGRYGKSIPVRLVFVRKRGKSKEYLVLISTDMDITEEEIIRIYGKRWGIETFFKVCKSYLRLTKECRAISYDAVTAYVSVVFARYMMLAVENRVMTDERTMPELYYSVCDELPDITWNEAFAVLMKILLGVVSEKLMLSEDELESIVESFLSALPETLKIKLRKSG